MSLPRVVRFCHLGIAVAAVLLAGVPGGQAEETAAVGTFRLRGGFDANPTLLPGGRGSAFGGADGAFAVGRDADGLKIALLGEVERTEYVERGLRPTERARLGVEADSSAIENWSLRAGLRVDQERTTSLQALDATQRLRAQWTGGPVRPFIALDAGYHTMNETNAILTDFLPQAHRFARITATPGVTMKWDDGEIGASVAASLTRYAEAVDLFGYRRDNERLQPFLFARYQGQGFSASASVSQLYGRWRDVDFSQVRETLYDVSVAKQAGRFGFEASAARFAADTTFPISPLAITESLLGKVSFAPDDAWTWSALVRGLRTRYLDSPFVAKTLAYGVSVSHTLPQGWTVGLDLLRIDSVTLNGDPARGGLASLSVSKRLSAGGKDEGRRWEPGVPPTAARLSPQSLKSVSLSSVGRAAYQPP